MDDMARYDDLRGVPVIALSPDHSVRRLTRLGACTHLTKPVDREAIAAAAARYASQFDSAPPRLPSTRS
jgi:ActR/RegA family two-component response regulator